MVIETVRGQCMRSVVTPAADRLRRVMGMVCIKDRRLLLNISSNRNAMLTKPEIIGYIAATLTTASFLPQAILTIKTKNTDSLSLSMYGAFTLGVFFWLVYGLYLSDKAIIIANAFTLVLATSILYVKICNSLRNNRWRNSRSNSGRYSR